MKKVLVILLALAVVAFSILALWQFVPLFGVPSEDKILQMEFDGYVKESLMDGIEFPEYFRFLMASAGRGFPAVLQIPDETGKIDSDIQITLRAEDGSWCYTKADDSVVPHFIDVRLGSTATVTNGQEVYWDDQVHDVEAQDIVSTLDFYFSDKDVTFVDMIIRKNDHIIGYLVGRFQVGYSQDHGRSPFVFYEVVDAAYFPMIDDAFQDIREECIEARIQMMKEDNRYPLRLYLVDAFEDAED